MKVLRVLMVFFCLGSVWMLAAGQACATEAEDKRMAILKAERLAVEVELAGVVNQLIKAPKENGNLIKKRDLLQRDLHDLDIEITKTGKMPEINKLDDMPVELKPIKKEVSKEEEIKLAEPKKREKKPSKLPYTLNKKK